MTDTDKTVDTIEHAIGTLLNAGVPANEVLAAARHSGSYGERRIAADSA